MQTANSWTRDNNTGNNFLGNGGTELNTTSSLYDLDYRNFDPILGRMNGVDPMADKYSSYTPYKFAFNDPVYWNDPNGADPHPGEPDYVTPQNLGPFISNHTSWGNSYTHITPGSGNNWADGIYYSDWSLNGGSQMYQQGLASCLTDIGGNLYSIGKDGTPNQAQENNGELGFWTQHYTDWYANGNLIGSQFNGTTFEAIGLRQGDPGNPSGWNKAGHALLQMFNLEKDDPALWGRQLSIQYGDAPLPPVGSARLMIKSLQVGLRNVAQIPKLIAAMKNGTYEYNAARGIIAGYKDAKGIYYISEGNHRMIAAQEILKTTGDAGPLNQLIANGRWTEVATAPVGARPLSGLDWYSSFRNWLGF